MKLILNTDGGARGNPGPAGIGAVISDETGKIISRHKKYIGEATNNVAEYKALILALQEAAKIKETRSKIQSNLQDILHPISYILNLEVRMDSELIVRQMQGKYKIKEPTLKELAAEVFKLTNNFESIFYKHIPREQNKEADKLVNEAVDEALANNN